jgi:hypothetical protein
MNRKTLLALAVAGGLGSSAASAATFLCETNPADISFRTCTEVVSGSSAAMNFRPLPEPPVTTYYSIEHPVTAYSIERPVATYYSFDQAPPSPSQLRVVPSRTVTTYEYSGQWPNTEPRVSTYRYYTLDSAR